MAKKRDPFAIDDVVNPEWTVDDFARAKPFKEVFPEQYKAWKKMGRPPVETHVPDAVTARTLRKADRGEDLVLSRNDADLFDKLGS